MSEPIQSSEASYRIGSMADLQILVQGVSRQSFLLGLPDVDRLLIATMVSELGANIVKYAVRGTVRITRAERMHAVDVDIWAEDHGPGIEDVSRAMIDRFSTGGTLGLGLPGVKRMADEFWIRSKRGQGTLVFARKTFHQGAAARHPAIATPAQGQAVRIESGQTNQYVYSMGWRPYPGNPFTGDAGCVVEGGAGCLMAIVDASGHGRGASQVAQLAMEVLQRFQGESPDQVFKKVHEALKGSTGAAMGLAFFDTQRKTMRYSATGNTRIVKISGKKTWTGIARDGVLGDRLTTLQIQEEPLEKGDLIVMWTDGIPDFDGRKMVEQHSFKAPREVCSMLVRELAKPYDDACCLAMRWSG